MLTVTKVRPAVRLAGSPTWKLHSSSGMACLTFGDTQKGDLGEYLWWIIRVDGIRMVGIQDM